MGYYTYFELNLKKASGNNLFAHLNPEPIIAELRSENDEAEYCLQDSGEGEERGKWYDYKDDFIAFSLKHPDVVFALTGEGEEQGDVWTHYFHNGKQQLCQAEIIYPPYDPSLMQ